MKSIFISSTFKDMQAERDILHQHIFPKLRRRLAACGEDVQELDLRWGVDTSQMSEEESGQFVIQTCIDSINRCKPYMIVLLGNRYGWIPDPKVVEEAEDTRILSWYGEAVSITQMEILYGALSQEALDRCIFCFRSEDFPNAVPAGLRPLYAAESPLHAEKLSKLKTEIRARKDACILEYDAVWENQNQSPGGLEAFEQQLSDALWNMIARDLPDQSVPKTQADLVLQNAELTKRQYLATYVSRKLDREEGPYALVGRRGFWFTGESGSGKSAMMANIAAKGQAVGAHIFLYFGGNAGCAGVDTLIDALLVWFERLIGTVSKPDPSETSLMKRARLYTLLEHRHSFDWALLIDGVDQMDQDVVPFLHWLADVVIREEKEQFWHGLAISSSSNFADRWEKELGDKFSRKKLVPLTVIEQNTMILNHAARRGKKIDAKVMQSLRALPCAKNPYHLSLLLQRLFMMDQHEFEQAEALAPGMEGLSRYMCRMIETMPEDTGELTVAFLCAATEKLAARMEQVNLSTDTLATPMEVLELFASSRDGASAAQLEQLLALRDQTFPTMFLEQLFCYLYDSFGESEQGTWSFKHRLLRENLISHMGRKTYLDNCALLLQYYETTDSHAEACFYYAWQAGDPAAGLRCLSQNEQTDRLLPLFLQILAQDGTDYLAALAQTANNREAGALLTLFEEAGDAVLTHWPQIEPWFSALAPGGDASAGLRAQYTRIELGVRIWDLDPEPYCAAWRRMTAEHQRLTPIDHDTCSRLRNACQQALGQERFSSLWPEALQLLRTIQTICTDEGWHLPGLQETIDWAGLLIQQSAAPAADRKELLLRMNTCLTSMDFSDSATLNLWYVRLADSFIREGSYTKGIELMDQVLHRIRFSHTFFNRMADTRLYVEALIARSAGLKKQFAVKYLQQARELCLQRVQQFPAAYWQYLLGLSGMRLYDAMSRSGEESLVDRASALLNEVIPELDRLIEEAGAEHIPEELLLEMLDQRYKRVMLRRKSPNPWQYREEQRADYRYMEKQYTALNAHSNNPAVLSDLIWCLLEEARYIDQCHFGDEEFVESCNKLWNIASASAGIDLLSLHWTSLNAMLDLAEILYRREYYDTAETLTKEIHDILEGLDSGQIVQQNKTERLYRATARYYLMEARLILHKQGDVNDGAGYIRLTAELLDGNGEGRAPLPAQDNSLRSEMWILFGELFHMAGKDSSVPEILDKTDAFWPEQVCTSALFNGTREDHIALLRYCKSLEMRARLREESSYMDRAVPYLKGLTDHAISDWETGWWPELYNALFSACRYYWQLPNQPELPQKLLSAVLGALSVKAKNGKLRGGEPVLLAEASLTARSCLRCPGLGTGCLPRPDWLRGLLEQMDVQEWHTAHNRVAARLAISLAVRGDFTASLDAAQDQDPQGAPVSLQLLALSDSALAAIKTQSAPQETLLPQALTWLESSLAKDEPFVRDYLELLCSLADSFGQGQSALEGGSRALTLLLERIHDLGSQVSKTILAEQAFLLAERLLEARQADWEQQPEEHIRLLRTADKLGREFGDTVQQPAARAKLLCQLYDIGYAMAGAYLRTGNRKKYNTWLVGTLAEMVSLEQDLTKSRAEQALKLYEEAIVNRDLPGNQGQTNPRDWMFLLGYGRKIWQALYRLTGQSDWMKRQASEAALYRSRLMETEQESLAWRKEKAGDSWDYDREAWLTLLSDHPTDRSLLLRYLDTVESQAAALTEGSERRLEEIVDELYALDTVSQQERTAVDRVIDHVTAKRKEALDDLGYWTLKALQDLGEDASIEQISAYIEAQRTRKAAASQL